MQQVIISSVPFLQLNKEPEVVDFIWKLKLKRKRDTDITQKLKLKQRGDLLIFLTTYSHYKVCDTYQERRVVWWDDKPHSCTGSDNFVNSQWFCHSLTTEYLVGVQLGQYIQTGHSVHWQQQYHEEADKREYDYLFPQFYVHTIECKTLLYKCDSSSNYNSCVPQTQLTTILSRITNSLCMNVQNIMWLSYNFTWVLLIKRSTIETNNSIEFWNLAAATLLSLNSFHTKKKNTSAFIHPFLTDQPRSAQLYLNILLCSLCIIFRDSVLDK